MDQFMDEVKKEEEMKIEEEDAPSSVISDSILDPQHQPPWMEDQSEGR